MKRSLQLISILLVAQVFLCSPLFALGTKANTLITNTVQIDYQAGGNNLSASASADFTVQELIDVALVWQDATNITTTSPAVDQVLTFELTNLGNGEEEFDLDFNAALVTDQFDPTSVQVWIDDGDGIFSTVTDTLFNGSNFPLLDGSDPANDAVRIFVVADIPAGLNLNDVGLIELTSTSVTVQTAGEAGNAGFVLTAVGDGATDVVIGSTGGQAVDTGGYEVFDPVTINKSQVITDQAGGTEPLPGSVITYSLVVNVANGVAADDLVITDIIPANTTFVPGSITLDDGTGALTQTDLIDSPVDFADFNVTTANTITVDVSQAGALVINGTSGDEYVITFQVKIN